MPKALDPVRLDPDTYPRRTSLRRTLNQHATTMETNTASGLRRPRPERSQLSSLVGDRVACSTDLLAKARRGVTGRARSEWMGTLVYGTLLFYFNHEPGRSSAKSVCGRHRTAPTGGGAVWFQA